MSLFGTAAAAPLYPIPELRYYQSDAVDAVHDHLGDGIATSNTQRTLLVLATGLGKTIIFSKVAAGWKNGKGRVLVLSHRDELVDQAKRGLERASGGEWVEKEKAEFRANHATRLVSGSVQTLYADARLKRFRPDHFDLIIVDESHHAIAPIYKKIVDYFCEAKVLGVTATPDRGDKKAMGQLFETVAYQMDILAGVEQGWLVPVIARRVYLEEIDISDVGLARGDLVAAQLDEKMLKACEGVVKETLALAGNRQTVGFLPGVRTAEYCCEKANLLAPESSIVISDRTDPDDRKRMMADFRKGRYQFLWNCSIVTEGVDVPSVSCIANAYLTRSRSRYAQTVGRGTRTEPGCVDDVFGADGRGDSHIRRALIAASKKPDMLLLDFVGNTGRHDLATIEEVLGGDYTEAERKLARKKATSGSGTNVRSALEAAREELRKVAASKAAKVKSRVVEVDPFKTIGIAGLDKYAIRPGRKPVDPRTRAYLVERLKYPAKMVDSLDRAGGYLLAKEVERRIKKGLASYAQLEWLQKAGINDPNITFERASKAMDYLKLVCKWDVRRADPHQLNRYLYGQREPGEEG